VSERTEEGAPEAAGLVANHRPLPAVDDREGDWCVTCGLPVIWDPRRVEFQHERPKP